MAICCLRVNKIDKSRGRRNLVRSSTDFFSHSPGHGCLKAGSLDPEITHNSKRIFEEIICNKSKNIFQGFCLEVFSPRFKRKAGMQ